MTAARDLTGALIAEKYELLHLIGRGGMGAVYEARNVATLRRCAVKVLLSPELAGDAEVVKRFFREARASGLIESEHVVAAFDSGIDAANHVYYVMERLHGEDLEQTLDRLGCLSPQVALKIALQAAKGMASAHALGIVHRDVKPANLFLAVGPGDEVRVKILDFGVAKVKMEVFNESASSLTHSGSLLGTPLYMSPEQLRRASAINESADVWSLGVVLFECLTGQLPWGDCDGIGELVAAILSLDVPPVQDLAPWVQPEVAEVVHRALSRNLGVRLKSAAELHDFLFRLVKEPRLLVEEIVAPAAEVRSSRAPRLSAVDTVMIGGTPPSGTPLVASSRSSAPKRLAPLAVGVGVALLAGGSAWSLANRATRSTGRAATATSAFDALSRSAPSPSGVAMADVAPVTPALKQFMLDVAPAGAFALLDGEPVPNQGGRILVQGPVGSVHNVRLTRAGRSVEQRIAITVEGLVPPKMAILQPSQRPVEQSPPAASAPVQPQTSPPVVPTPVAPPGTRLSEKFE